MCVRLGSLLLSSFSLPEPSLAEKLTITLPPEKLSIGQIQDQRQAVRDRAEKKIFDVKDLFSLMVILSVDLHSS